MPNAQDLVLGGEMPPPVSGAVLGGVAGLNQRFEQGNLIQKLATLAQAAQYEDCLSLLYRGLEHDNLTVRAEAYIQLKVAPTLSSPPPILQRGIPLRVGDRIYGVFHSCIEYGDDFYYIRDNLSEWYLKNFSFI